MNKRFPLRHKGEYKKREYRKPDTCECAHSEYDHVSGKILSYIEPRKCDICECPKYVRDEELEGYYVQCSSVESEMGKITDAEKERVKKMYDCDESPLDCQIIPRGTFDIIESRKITKEDFDELWRENKQLKEKSELNQKIVDRFENLFLVHKKTGSPINDKYVTGVDQSDIDQIYNIITDIFEYIENDMYPIGYTRLRDAKDLS